MLLCVLCQAHRRASRRDGALGVGNRRFAEVEDRRSQHRVRAAIAHVRALGAGTDHRAIKAGVDGLARATDDFAARRMDSSIRSALAGHKVDEIPL